MPQCAVMLRIVKIYGKEPFMSRKLKKTLIITDFDGTVCTSDLGNHIINEFSTASMDDVEKDYVKGKIGSRIAYERIAERLRGSKEQMLDHVLAVEQLDPYFLEFFSLARSKGIDMKIVSDGLDFYIRAVLEKYNLAEMEYFCNRAVFRTNDLLSVEFPQKNEFCGRCGTCKSRILNSYRIMYNEIVYIGDGYSDFCPSRYADVVFAKKILFQKCEQEGTPCFRFNDFSEIKKYFLEKY